MTQGEYRVGINFNPAGADTVNKIKRAAADLIDLIDSIESHCPDEDQSDNAWVRFTEIQRLIDIAKTEVESAAMWAVKAATKPAMEE